MNSARLPRYVDRQFVASFLLTIVFYGTLIPLLVATSWWLEEIAAAGFLLFLLWAYRWPIGARLGLCARRPGALPPQPSSPPASPQPSSPVSPIVPLREAPRA